MDLLRLFSRREITKRCGNVFRSYFFLLRYLYRTWFEKRQNYRTRSTRINRPLSHETSYGTFLTYSWIRSIVLRWPNVGNWNPWWYGLRRSYISDQKQLPYFTYPLHYGPISGTKLNYPLVWKITWSIQTLLCQSVYWYFLSTVRKRWLNASWFQQRWLCDCLLCIPNGGG